MIKLSVVTVTYDAVTTFSNCLASIAEQSCAGIEHVIIDGGSTDGTVAVARTFPHVSLIVSEPDQGIYDAMNKGICLSQGDIVGILNADDVYASSDVLTKVVTIFENPGIDACFGDLVYVDNIDTEKVVRYWRSGAFVPRRFYRGWMPPHPTFFVRRSVYDRFGLFNLNLGSAADYELMLRFLVKNEIKAAYIPEVLVRMRTGGISTSWRNRVRANRMDRKAWTVNGLKPYPWTLWLKPLRKVGQWLFR